MDLQDMAHNSQAGKIRVLIADDHGVVREGLMALFQTARDIEVVGAVARADELRDAIERTRCDLLLLDLQLDRWMTNEIGELAKLTKVVVLTGSPRAQDMIDAFNRGARGIVQKTFAAETVREAIRAVAGGLVWMPADLRRRLMSRSEGVPSEQLTRREVEIVRQVAVGLRNAEVAQNLSISVGTVKIHLNNIFNKLNIRDRVELTLYALRNRLVAIPEQGD